MAVYKRRVLELLLEEIRLPMAGRTKDGVCPLIFALGWPRPGIAERVSAVNAEIADEGYSWAQARWGEKVVFKETVQGPCNLGVHVVERQSPRRAALLLRRMAERVIKDAGKRVAETEGMLAGGLLFGTALDYLKEVTSGKVKSASLVVAAGGLDLLPDAAWQGGKTCHLTIPLFAPEPVYRMKRVRRQGSWTTRRETLLEAGAANGMVQIAVTPYE